MDWLAQRIPFFDRKLVVTAMRCKTCASVVGHVEGEQMQCKRCGSSCYFLAAHRITRYEKLLLYLGVR